MSQPPDLPEAGRPHLQRALAQLPLHEPDATLWPRITRQLDAEAAPAQALPPLPLHEPDDDLWLRIAAQLDAETALPTPAPAPITRRLWPAYRVAAGLAAAVLLVFAIWQVKPAPTTLRDTISYHQEVVPAPAEAFPAPPAPAADPLAQQSRRFIDAQCSALPAVCQSADFQHLRAQLTELDAEEQRLQQAIHRLGPSPDMLRHQVQVATLKATLTRDLIQLLIS
ncbi:hypothetical protein Q5H93_15680 [Hymenobacter sp. ASUV-10]|uniref:Anti-sigma factor n=1 Tax=Hymenobacter aranciens TaxID=3063996 RepID=A0ABT9BD58_9BACT|nr:hypothetical protein [Hymenobacter sp. ASUV-10]MDO7876185.1 hypothetical protein [Hymenobacter sp. ASUV-10]